MLDNLRLDLSNSTVLANTTASNTNADATALNYLKNGGGTTSDKYPTAKINNVAWTSSSQNYYSIPMTMSSGNCESTTWCVDNPSSGTWNKDATATSYGKGSGKIGVYYNYCTASAGTYCWGNGTSDTGSPTSDPKSGTEYDIDGDICPKSWKIPTGEEYDKLAIALDLTFDEDWGYEGLTYQTALSTPLSGSFYDGSSGLQNALGFFWSSSWSDRGYATSLEIQNGMLNVSRYYREDGYSVRCLLE